MSGTGRVRWNVCFVLVFAIAVSCSEHKPVVGNYYNIDSLFDKQIGLLLKGKATLEKNARVGDEDSRVVFVPVDSASWAGELDIFRNLNAINKPVNRGLYRDTVRKDRSSNLTVRIFEALDEDLPVERLEIFFLNAPHDIRRMEATYREENVMFRTKRRLRIDFRKKDAGSVISAYSVTGGQKMLLGDSVRYAVTAKISIPHD